MCWGIECPLGWFNIIKQLCTVLEFYNMEFVKNHGVAIVANQVKEKFGTLRFYYTVRPVDENGIAKMDIYELSTEEDRKRGIVMEYLEMLADDIIREAEAMTETTCADCGIPLDKDNMVETKGWITYICKECDEKRHKEWEEDLKKMREEKYTPEPKDENEYEGVPTEPTEDELGYSPIDPGPEANEGHQETEIGEV
jgi:uncharacterized Zn finger protein (UPF0148 family)